MSKLQIKCPSCGQPFQVDDRFKGKTVECGACDYRFKVSDTLDPVEVVEKKEEKPADEPEEEVEKQYPGEKKSDLKGFKSSLPKQAPPANVTETAYKRTGDVDVILPLSPKHIVCIYAGLAAFLIGFLIFMTGGKSGGFLEDVVNEDRLAIAGVLAGLGFVLLVYGAKKHRILAFLGGAGLAAGLCYMPTVFPETFSPEGFQPLTLEKDDDNADPEKKPEDQNAPPKDVDPATLDDEAYKAAIGYSVMELALERGNADTTYGIALVNYKKSNKSSISNYIRHISLNRITAPLVYDDSGRKVGNTPVALVVASNLPASLNDTKSLLSRIGEIKNVRTDLRVIEIEVDQTHLYPANTEVLRDDTKREYYQACLNDLKHLDPRRQRDAVTRLLTAPEQFHAADISKALAELLSRSDLTFKNDVLQALNRWAKPEHEIDSLVLGYANTLKEIEKPIPMELMQFLVGKEVAGADDILSYAWLASPTKWQAIMIDSPSIGERAITKALAKAEDHHLKSAATVLEEIGSKDVIPLLEKAMTGKSEEVQKSLKATIDAIKNKP